MKDQLNDQPSRLFHVIHTKHLTFYILLWNTHENTLRITLFTFSTSPYFRIHFLCQFVQINDVGIEPKLDRQSGANRIHFCGKEGVQIKLCDFGLAVFFPKVQGATKTSFHSRKFVGKSRYWSPELSAHHTFDARANDIWCLGVWYVTDMIYVTWSR